MKFNALTRSPFFWSFASGVLVGTSYPPFRGWSLFFCLVPLWTVWLHEPHLGRVFATGFIAQFTLTLIGFHWVAHTAHEFGQIPWALSFLVLLAYCSFASLHIALAGVFVVFLKCRFHFSATFFFFSLALVTASLEWFYPMILPWNMGYPLLYNKLQTSQLAEFIGFHGLSLLVLLANSGFALAAYLYPQKNWSRPVLIFVITLFFTETAGYVISKNLTAGDKTAKVLFVQPNIGNFDRYYLTLGDKYQEPVVEKHIELITKAMGLVSSKPDVMVLPEVTYPAYLDSMYQNQKYSQMLIQLVKSLGVPTIIGTFSQSPKTQDSTVTTQGTIDYNGVFGITSEGQVAFTYRKHILLAFGEYFPGADYFPALKKIIPSIADFGRGPGPVVFKFSNIHYAPYICYEALYSQYIGKIVKHDLVHFLVNPSNDSWYGDSAEPYQHMVMSQARAIEFRRPLLRPTNTGFSLAVDARGNILKMGPQNQEWWSLVEVPYASQPVVTIYEKWAPYSSWFFLSLLLGVVVIGFKYRKT